MEESPPAEASLDRLNTASADEAERMLLTCCASRTWARTVARALPVTGRAALKAAADAAYAELTWSDIEEAMAAHPRIGDRPANQWSRQEQSGVEAADQAIHTALHEGDLAYEKRFGHVFLICATGLSAEQLLAALRERLAGDIAAERRIVRAELRKITHLRLDRL